MYLKTGRTLEAGLMNYVIRWQVQCESNIIQSQFHMTRITREKNLLDYGEFA